MTTMLLATDPTPRHHTKPDPVALAAAFAAPPRRNHHDRNLIVLANLPLIPKVLRSILGSSGPGRPYDSLGTWDDAMNVAVIGLMHAAERYDATRGTKFSSLACKYMRGVLLNALHNCRLVRVPIYAVGGKGRYGKQALDAVCRTGLDEQKGEWTGAQEPEPDNREKYEALYRGLARLSVADQQLLMARYRDGRELRVLALSLDISKEGVRLRVQRALERLREHLEE